LLRPKEVTKRGKKKKETFIPEKQGSVAKKQRAVERNARFFSEGKKDSGTGGRRNWVTKT